MRSVALFRQHLQLLAEVHFRGAPQRNQGFSGLIGEPWVGSGLKGFDCFALGNENLDYAALHQGYALRSL